MTFYFFDTSALVKRYHGEPGSEQVNAVFDDQDSILIISELALVELASALRRKHNRGEITVKALNEALAYFAQELMSDFVVASFRSGFIPQARDLVLQHGLRTLDALQLTSALEFKALSPVFACADADALCGWRPGFSREIPAEAGRPSPSAPQTNPDILPSSRRFRRCRRGHNGRRNSTVLVANGAELVVGRA